MMCGVRVPMGYEGKLSMPNRYAWEAGARNPQRRDVCNVLALMITKDVTFCRRHNGGFFPTFIEVPQMN